MFFEENKEIAYDRNWLMTYAENTFYQRCLLEQLERKIYYLRYEALLNEVDEIDVIQLQIGILKESLRKTEDVIRQFHNNVETSIAHLLMELQNID